MIDTNKKPRIAVIGLGKYYQKLRPGLEEYFTPAVLIDRVFSPRVDSLYDRIDHLDLQAILILTPNKEHATQILEIAPLRLPTFVDKPLVTTQPDLDKVLECTRDGLFLYCSDFYPDVRALPLLMWFGQSNSILNNRVKVDGDFDLWKEGRTALGNIKRLDAVLLEAEGNARGFEGREWLWDSVHGGVLWDLAYHYLTLWDALLGEPLNIETVRLEYADFAPVKPSAETSAEITFQSNSGIIFHIRVHKYGQDKNERWLRIEGDKGQAIMNFSNLNTLIIRSEAKQCEAVLMADYYMCVSEAFRFFIDTGGQSHGLQSAVRAIKLLLETKQLGNDSRATKN